MPETPQFKEAYPVLQGQNVSSHAEGYENFAKTLASFGEKATETAVAINKEKSDTMYMNSVANAEQAKREAQIQLVEHPENAAKILEHSTQTLNEIKDSASVNSHDRAKLSRSIQSAKGDISLDVAKTSVRQTQLVAAQTHFFNWPNQVQAYKDMLRKDPKTAETMYESMVSSLKGLVATRVITPVQAANNLKDIHGAVDLEARYHKLLQNADATAEDYHRVDSSPYNNGADNTHSPINEDSAWLIDHFSNDKAIKNIDAGLQAHKLPNMEVYSSLKEGERNHVDDVQAGVSNADALTRSSAPYPKITQRLDELNAHKDSLNVRDNAERIALDDFKNNLKNDYLGTVSNLPAGKQILRNYNDRNAAIGQMAGIPAADKQQMLNENNDHMVSQMVAYGQATHVPADQIKPFPKAILTAAQQGFGVGGNPGMTLATLRSFSPENQIYLANSMASPRQQVIMQTISFAKTNIADQDALDFISANQSRSYNEIDLKTEDKVDDNYLKNQINTKIPNAIKIIQGQNSSQNGVTLNGQLIQSGVNYAKYLSEKNGQFSFKKDGGIFDSTANVSDVARLINASYNPVSGADYIFNKNQLNVTQAQADNIAMYAREGATSHLSNSLSPQTQRILRSRMAMNITVTPTNDLVAQDPSGNVLFSEHLTTNLMKHIQSEMPALKQKRKDEQIDNYVFDKLDTVNKVYQGIKNLPSSIANAVVPPAYGETSKGLPDGKTETPSKMTMSNSGYSFLKFREGDIKHPGKFRADAYDDGTGKLTIGWGHIEGVKKGDHIDKPTAERYLQQDVKAKEKAVKEAIKVPLTQNQYHALTSFAFNEGENALKNSTLAKVINKGGSRHEIEEAFRMWNKAKIKGKKVEHEGLKNRRELEIKLFFKGKK